MSGDAPWESAFVATCVALGVSSEDAAAALGAAGAKREASLLRALAAPERPARAGALAAALGVIAIDLEKTRLT